MKLFNKILAREKYHPVLSYPIFLAKIFCLRRRYAKTLERLRASAKPLRVAFLSAGPSKWKCQSVYDKMSEREGAFHPVVVSESSDIGFYLANGCRVEIDDGYALSEADLVIYQDPWAEISGKHPVSKVSRTALCCYIPYSIESIAQGGRSERFDYHHLADFHSLMFACFQWSEAYAKHYKKVQFPFERAGSVLGFGHPSLDVYYGKSCGEGGCIIYAPHFGFEYNGIMPISSIGTFPWSGMAVLEYAKSHPEQKWLFKPHPKLRDRLVEIGFMTKAQVDSYYAEWGRIADVCYDGNYAKWFLDSTAMVTDSNSFLLEYMAVGKPLIHLVPEKSNMVACAEAEEVFKTFYVAKNVDEMKSAFRLVLEDRRDPRHDARVAAAKEARVLDNHAGKRIVDWIEEQIRA